MIIKRRLTALLICVMLIGAAPVAHAQNPPGFEDAIKILDAWVGTMVAQRGQPGLSIGVVLGDGLVWSKGYGYADVEQKTAATTRTLYRIASITKTFTAVAILQLRDGRCPAGC
jgi:CubicO group peptidase (beta-lactamase class C family)